jgi:CheY-like chemotaxis protein
MTRKITRSIDRERVARPLDGGASYLPRRAIGITETGMPMVLVVDDNSDIVSAVSEALTEEGWDVVTALSAKDATPAAQSRKIDVVLCDVLLGDGSDGPALRDRFASEGLGQIPFVFVTASTREVARLAGELVLPKPFAVSAVLEILDAAINRPELERASNDG